MARIAGVDLPRDKRVEIGLTYIFGIGRKTSNDQEIDRNRLLPWCPPPQGTPGPGPAFQDQRPYPERSQEDHCE